MTTYKLFLDDDRDPPDKTWVVARSVAKAQKLIQTRGWPSEVSFDENLGYRQPTGSDFAQWLHDRHRSGDQCPESLEYHTHSSSLLGRIKTESVMAFMTHKAPLHSNDFWWERSPPSHFIYPED